MPPLKNRRPPGTAARRRSSYPQRDTLYQLLSTPTSPNFRDPLKIGPARRSYRPGNLAVNSSFWTPSGRFTYSPYATPTVVATPRDIGTGTRIHSVSSGPAGARAVPACVSPFADLLLKSRSMETLADVRQLGSHWRLCLGLRGRTT